MDSPLVSANEEWIHIKEAASYIRSKLPSEYEAPLVGIVCGSGLSNIASRITDAIHLPYKDIPFFPQPTVDGHGSHMVVGKMRGVLVACLMGRFHFYEGHSLLSTVFPIRVLSQLGIHSILITNAAGSINPSFSVGDIMVIEDHISFLNLSGLSILRGANISEMGPRFPALTKAYHPSTHQIITRAAIEVGISQDIIRSGVYVGVGGPAYETPAEIKLMRMIGGGAVGMSTIPEVIAAVHCGLRVFAFSLITNIGICRGEPLIVDIPTHEEVLLATQARSKELEELVLSMIPQIS